MRHIQGGRLGLASARRRLTADQFADPLPVPAVGDRILTLPLPQDRRLQDQVIVVLVLQQGDVVVGQGFVRIAGGVVGVALDLIYVHQTRDVAHHGEGPFGAGDVAARQQGLGQVRIDFGRIFFLQRDQTPPVDDLLGRIPDGRTAGRLRATGAGGQGDQLTQDRRPLIVRHRERGVEGANLQGEVPPRLPQIGDQRVQPDVVARRGDPLKHQTLRPGQGGFLQGRIRRTAPGVRLDGEHVHQTVDGGGEAGVRRRELGGVLQQRRRLGPFALRLQAVRILQQGVPVRGGQGHGASILIQRLILQTHRGVDPRRVDPGLSIAEPRRRIEFAQQSRRLGRQGAIRRRGPGLQGVLQHATQIKRRVFRVCLRQPAQGGVQGRIVLQSRIDHDQLRQFFRLAQPAPTGIGLDVGARCGGVALGDANAQQKVDLVLARRAAGQARLQIGGDLVQPAQPFADADDLAFEIALSRRQSRLGPQLAPPGQGRIIVAGCDRQFGDVGLLIVAQRPTAGLQPRQHGQGLRLVAQPLIAVGQVDHRGIPGRRGGAQGVQHGPRLGVLALIQIGFEQEVFHRRRRRRIGRRLIQHRQSRFRKPHGDHAARAGGQHLDPPAIGREHLAIDVQRPVRLVLTKIEGRQGVVPGRLLGILRDQAAILRLHLGLSA